MRKRKQNAMTSAGKENLCEKIESIMKQAVRSPD